jgi:hypothetical protein
MIRIRISALTLAFAVLLNAGATFGQSGVRSRRDVNLPVYEWLREPDRQEIPVKLQILGPLLTFEQRQQVRVVLIVDGRALQKKGAQRELHFLMKVADESGHWYSEENYGSTTISAKLGGHADLELVSDAYFQPGDYTIAIIVHDAVQNQRTVLRRQIRVPHIKNDPMPQLGNGLPRVEFLPDPVLGVASLGMQGATLPLRSTRPIHIDLIVDFGAYREYLRTRRARFYASKLLQTSQVVSRIRPTNGCLEVSAVDILRTEIFFRRKQASQLRWWDVREQILGRNLETVDANVLGARRKTASLFAKFLGDLLKEPATCGRPDEHLERVVLIVASGVAFPPKTEVEPAEIDCDCRIFYLRQVANPFYPFDDLPRLLKRQPVRKTDLNKPEDLRKRLAEMFTSFEEPSKSRN